MSRSYRKHPIIVQEKNDAHASNRKIRRAKLDRIPKGGAYKKYGLGWTWAYYYPLEDAKRDYLNNEYLQRRYLTLEDYLNYYKKVAIRK